MRRRCQPYSPMLFDVVLKQQIITRKQQSAAYFYALRIYIQSRVQFLHLQAAQAHISSLHLSSGRVSACSFRNLNFDI